MENNLEPIQISEEEIKQAEELLSPEAEAEFSNGKGGDE